MKSSAVLDDPGVEDPALPIDQAFSRGGRPRRNQACCDTYQTYMFVYINFVDPTWVDTVAEVWSAQLEESGATAEQIDKRITNFRKQWETGFVFTLGLIAYALPEIVLGLLAMVLGVVQPWKKGSSKRGSITAPSVQPGSFWRFVNSPVTTIPEYLRGSLGRYRFGHYGPPAGRYSYQ